MFNIGECHMDPTERSTIIDVLWLDLQSVRRKTLAAKMLPAYYRLSEPPHALQHSRGWKVTKTYGCTWRSNSLPSHLASSFLSTLWTFSSSYFCGKTDQSLQIAEGLPPSGLRTFFHLLWHLATKVKCACWFGSWLLLHPVGWGLLTPASWCSFSSFNSLSFPAGLRAGFLNLFLLPIRSHTGSRER